MQRINWSSDSFIGKCERRREITEKRSWSEQWLFVEVNLRNSNEIIRKYQRTQRKILKMSHISNC